MASGTCDPIFELYETILSRKREMPEGSYTAELFRRGKPYIAQKVGEEAVEVAVAYLSEGKERTVSEIADLVYHLLVLMADAGIRIEDVIEELERRRK